MGAYYTNLSNFRYIIHTFIFLNTVQSNINTLKSFQSRKRPFFWAGLASENGNLERMLLSLHDHHWLLWSL